MRDKVSIARLRPEQESTDDLLLKTYNTAMSTAAAEVIERWKAGHAPPNPDGRLVVTKVLRETGGPVIGFNVYLEWAEPHVLGPMRIEVEQ